GAPVKSRTESAELNNQVYSPDPDPARNLGARVPGSRGQAIVTVPTGSRATFCSAALGAATGGAEEHASIKRTADANPSLSHRTGLRWKPDTSGLVATKFSMRL